MTLATRGDHYRYGQPIALMGCAYEGAQATYRVWFGDTLVFEQRCRRGAATEGPVYLNRTRAMKVAQGYEASGWSNEAYVLLAVKHGRRALRLARGELAEAIFGVFSRKEKT